MSPTKTHIRRHLAILLHTYPGLTPFNVWDVEWDVLADLIEAAKRSDHE